jgi:hypothetical protein
MAMTCSNCETLMAATKMRMRFQDQTGTGPTNRLRILTVWRCGFCGLMLPFNDNEVFGWCDVCGAKVVEEDYAENFPEHPNRLLISFVAKTEDLASGTYVYGCPICTRCSQCQKALGGRDYVYRMQSPQVEEDTMRIRSHYFHPDCLKAWDAKYAAEMLEAKPVEPLELLKDFLQIE